MSITSLILISVISFIVFIVLLYNFILYTINRRIPFFQRYIVEFDSYIKVLDYHLAKAYDVIYKDRILVYSIEATKLNEKEFSVVAKDFLTLVLKMLGPNLVKEFLILYGNEKTFFFNITEYFNTKFEDDEIRKTATMDLSNTETLT